MGWQVRRGCSIYGAIELLVSIQEPAAEFCSILGSVVGAETECHDSSMFRGSSGGNNVAFAFDHFECGVELGIVVTMGAVDDTKMFNISFGADGGFNRGPASDWVQRVDYQGWRVRNTWLFCAEVEVHQSEFVNTNFHSKYRCEGGYDVSFVLQAFVS